MFLFPQASIRATYKLITLSISPCLTPFQVPLSNCTQATRSYIDISAMLESAADRKRHGVYTESGSALKTTHRDDTMTFESQRQKAVIRETAPLEKNRGTLESVIHM